MKIIGREREVKQLMDIYDKNKPELVAIYGRRRVGKTYLVNNVFKNKFTFKHTALSSINEETSKNTTMEEQLYSFFVSLRKYGCNEKKKPKNWFEAFYYLECLLEQKGDDRQVVFFDELPWLDTPKSNFIKAFESFWNGWANSRNIIVIICGSANSWIVNNMINNYGGLYNRVTKQIKLNPFSLGECEEFYKENDINFSRYDIVQSYMILGGIPYYMDNMQKGLSLVQNINELFFSKTGVLKNEYRKLFASAFKNPEYISTIVKILSKKKIGLSREEILEGIGEKHQSEKFNSALNALIESDFVIKYRPLKETKKDLYYKLIDPFCLFYLQFVDNSSSLDNKFFIESNESQKIVSWRGIAFENVCFNHIDQIKRALKVEGVRSNNYPFVQQNTDEHSGSQIDLVIDRNDGVTNLCEMKYYGSEYVLNKEEYIKSINKQEILKKYISPKNSIFTVLITTYGLKNNNYSHYYQNVLTFDDLFSIN